MPTLHAGLYAVPRGTMWLDLAARGQNIRFSNNERGFASFTCFVPMTTEEAIFLFDRPGLPHVLVSWNGLTIWEGRLEDVELVEDGVELGAYGYIRGYADLPYSVAHIGVTAQAIAQALVAFVSGSNTRMSSATMFIQNPGVALAERYEDRYPIEILDRLCGLGDNTTTLRMWEACVWADRILRFQPRGYGGRKFYIDIAKPSLQRTLETLWNSAYAVYQDGSNNRIVNTTNSNAASISRNALTRRMAIGVQSNSQLIADGVRDAFLTEHMVPPVRSDGIEVEWVYDQHGRPWPAWILRSGDQVTIRNLPMSPPIIGSSIDRIRTFRVKEIEATPAARRTRIITEMLKTYINPADDAERRASIRDPNLQHQPRPTLPELYSDFASLPGLRALWYPAAVDQTGALYDQSGQGRTLSMTGNPTVNVHNDFIPYFDYDGAGDYHSAGDAAWMDITGTETTIATALRGLTLGGWFWFDTLATGSNLNPLLAKWVFTASNNRSFTLDYSAASGKLRFGVSSNGTAVTTVETAAAPSTGAWHFIVARFTPGAELAIWIDGVKTVNTTSIPASIFNSSAALMLATFDAAASASNILDGRCALAFILATLLTAQPMSKLFERTRVFFGV